MRVCMVTNLAASSVLVALFAFAGCNSKPAEAPDNTQVTKTVDDPGKTIPPESEGAAGAGATDEGTSGGSEGAGSDEPKDRDTAQIAEIVKANRQAARDCYEKAKKDLPTLQGDLTIKFVLDGVGKVKSAEVNQDRTTLKSPDVGKCVINVIKGLKFPPSAKGMDTEVNYPFNFKP